MNFGLRTIEKAKKPIAAFLLLSLFIHLGVFISFALTRVTPPTTPTRVEVEFKAADELTPADETDSKRRKREKEPDRDQIVEQKQRLNDEVDEKSRFLSAFNQKVVRETRADRSGRFTNTAAGGAKAEGRRDGDKRSQAEAKHPSRRSRGELPDLKDLTPKFALEPGQQGPPADRPGDPSRTDDYLKNVKSGLQTLLSTREFVYYAYYNRIKDSLRQHWEPDVRERVKIIYRQGRSLASAKDRITQVLVTLDSKGELLRVEVLNQSGVIDLDNAAVQAFREAAPFPNPPKGMIESDGTVKIRWDFVLEV